MADFIVQQVTSTHVEASAVPATFKDLTITNVANDVNGVLEYSGFDLEASNFTVGGDVTITNPGGLRTIVEGSGEGDSWNASSGISKVELSDNGTPGDPSNTINARVHHTSFTMPASNVILNVDFDAIATPGHGPGKRPVHVITQTAVSGSDHVSIVTADIANITETSKPNLADAGHQVISHSGFVDDNVSSHISTTTITADSGYYLVNKTKAGKAANAFYRVRSIGGKEDAARGGYINLPWRSYWSTEVYDTKNAEGQTTSTQVKTFYTPPQEEALNPDPYPATNDFCDWGQEVYIDYEAATIAGSKTNSNITAAVTSVSISQTEEQGSVNFEQVIAINANKPGRVSLIVVEVDSSNAIQKYYNFTTNAFQSGAANKAIVFTASTGNRIIENVVIPATTTDKIYSVYLDELTAGGAPYLDVPTGQSNIPDAHGEMIFHHRAAVAANKVTIDAGTIANVVKGGSAVSFPPGRQLTGSLTTANRTQKTATFTHTKTGDRTLSLTRQPYTNNKVSNVNGSTNRDFRGWNQFASLGSQASSGATSLVLNNTDNAIGLKVGMKVSDTHFPGTSRKDGTSGTPTTAAGQAIPGIRVANDTKITAINSRTLTISPALSAAIPSGDKLYFYSDYSYTVDEAVATINGANTIVTTVCKITIDAYGENVPDGNITLQPNYITST